MHNPRKLFLLDAMALIYRAYFAFSKNPRINSKGMNTSAVLGFTNTLLEVLKKEKPSHIAVAFDSAAPTLRKTDFEAYKANREAPPEDIISALPYIRQLLDGFGIPSLIKDGYEADDIIGTLAKRAEKDGFTVFMMTSDKDFGQLVSDNIFMYKPARMGNGAEVWGVKEVCERYEIERPEQLIDILGLWGDASDNIPGVPGIGEVKAKKLIQEFGSIENILENIGQVKEKRSQENLKEFAEQAMMSKNLATILLDVPVVWDEQAFRLSKPEPARLVSLFEELEFRTLANKLFADKELFDITPLIDQAGDPALTSEKAEPQPGGQMDLFSQTDAFADPAETDLARLNRLLKEKKYTGIHTDSDIVKLTASIRKAGGFCFDTETTGLDMHEAALVGIAFSIQKDEAFFVYYPDNKQDTDRINNLLKPIFEDAGLEKTGQNLKFDIGILKQYDIEVKGKLFDTMLAHYLLQPDMRHNMDVLSETYLDYKPVSIESLIGKKGKSQKTMREVPLDILTAYACEDADITLQLRNVFEPMLAEAGLTDLFNQVETPLIRVLADMENTGVSIDVAALNEYSAVLAGDIQKMEDEIFSLAGVRFNIGSPKQLGDILFDKLKIVGQAKKTKTKQYSTSEDVLSKLIDKHPIVERILSYRSLTKLKSTYVDVLPRLINARTGRIHTSYNQAVAATGRLSSNNPNLQNIPVRSDEGQKIRQAFVAKAPEYVLLAADYSQIELRIIAALSQDEAMLQAFNQGLDIHTATAAKVYGVEISQVTKEMRRSAKTVNFGIVYGISAFGLSERLNIPRQEAAQIINQYFDKYPGIKQYMDATIEYARKHEYVKTILGRRRYLKDINSGNGAVRGFAERNAINAPIQGSAADMIKVAMINIYEAIQQKGLKSKMIMQVHDELVFDAHKDEVDILKRLVEETMKTAITLPVPIVVDMNTGDNWLQAH